MNNIPAYQTNNSKTDSKKIRYLFESLGSESIIKAIEYTPVKSTEGTTIYNLGFGDYNEENGTISDEANSNNGDMRKVFSTVLSTVPSFFSATDNSALWIQGSDSSTNYKAECEPNCTKNCSAICKNEGRRIKAYRYYVDKNFEDLSTEYIFFGLTEGEEGDLVQYIPGNNYNGILIYKKK